MIPFPNKKYGVIYADPPWNFSNWSEKGAKKSATQHYSCMSMEDINNLPVANIAADDCILFMWVTDPLLDKQLETIKRWDFTYKTIGFTWVKYNKKTATPFMGLGYFTRSNPECCIIATRGKPGRPKDRGIRQVVMSPIREHSRKPDVIRAYIEKMYPDIPRIELFARTTIEGWDVWGNQTDKFATPIELG